MPVIQYISYRLPPSADALDSRAYEHLRSMTKDQYDEFIDASASSAWRDFWSARKFVGKFILIGGGLSVLCSWIPFVNVVAALVLVSCFFTIVAVMFSALSHCKYVFQYRRRLKHVRDLIVRSTDFRNYLEIHNTELGRK